MISTGVGKWYAKHVQQELTTSFFPIDRYSPQLRSGTKGYLLGSSMKCGGINELGTPRDVGISCSRYQAWAFLMLDLTSLLPPCSCAYFAETSSGPSPASPCSKSPAFVTRPVPRWIPPPSSTGISRLSPAPETLLPYSAVLPGNLLVTDWSMPDSTADHGRSV